MTFSGKFFFPSKVLEFLHVLLNLVEKHPPVSFFLTKMLLFSFVALIVHASIFVFVFLRKKVQTSPKKYRGMVYYLIEKHMQKFRHF